MPERKPAKKSTPRVQRHRQLKGDGVLLVSLKLTEDETDTLHRRGYLAEHEVDDKGAVANAVHQWIAREKQLLDDEP